VHIIIRDNERGTSMLRDVTISTCILTDVTIARGRNVNKKETKKILKYKDLATEIQCMGNTETKVVPVIMEPSQTHS
jgi:hypothetical protein